MPRLPINCILAVDTNNGIACRGMFNGVLTSYIPWNLKGEMTLFKKTTCTTTNSSKQNAVIMGRTTWECIPEKNKPLKDRLNVIITSQDLKHNNVLFFGSPEQAIIELNKRDDIESIFIIGGEKLYNQYINSSETTNLYITRINKNYYTHAIINMDDKIMNQYNKISSEQHQFIDLNSENNELVNVTFEKYTKNKKPHPELQYLNILKEIIDNGHYRQTRNAKTYSLFGKYMEFDLTDGKFPLLTTKKMFLRGIFEELVFFLTGSTDTKLLENKSVNIWKGNTSREFLDSLGPNFKSYEVGDMGPMYGYQLLHFNAEYHGCNFDYSNQGINQVQNIIDLLIKDRYSRRIIMTTFNPAQADCGVLYPCHGIVIQFGIQNDDELCCHMHQRSADWILGEPFNIASYAMLMHIICEIVNNQLETNLNIAYEMNSSTEYFPSKLQVGKLSMSFGDVHIYDEHIEVAKEQLQRRPYDFPVLKINKKLTSLQDLNDFKFTDIKLENYNSHSALKANMVA